jgi:DNA-binding response OmpR family regulator
VARIVLAEDTEQLRELATRFLERAGHTVLQAADGHAALAKCRETPVDLVVCDMFMPDMDGLEVIRELHRASPATPVIAMSGGGCGGVVDVLGMAKLLGAASVLNKPFTRAELLACVDEVLGRKRAG